MISVLNIKFYINFKYLFILKNQLILKTIIF
jgi:hypothetical protein